MLVRISIAILFIFAGQPVFGTSLLPQVEAIRTYVEQVRAGSNLTIAGQTISSILVLPSLYERRDYAPVWDNPHAVRQLIEALEQVESDGLISSDYHLPVIQKLHANNPAGDPETAAGLDILMTDALIRLGYHLLVGKVDADELDTNWNMTTTIGDLDTILALADSIESARIPQLIEHFRPDHEYYAYLQQGLAHYRAIRDQGGWQNVPSGPALKSGMADERIPVIRERLNVTGALSTADTTSDIYDETLTVAVKQFQQHHGLTADGVIGPATVAAMNVPVQARIDQIKVNLERARWVLHDLPEDMVIVDIAGFEVSYRRGGKIVWSTPAQVGTPFRQTPVFRDQIRYLEVNPTWTVPPTILQKDILPQLAKDPSYLQQKDMQVLTHDGQNVDPTTIDWFQYPQKRFPHLLRQNPGPNNALGRIKFMFPNKHLVYLHDTPSRNLFERDQRAFSSGCIRVKNPFELAELLLDDPQWTQSRIDEVVKSKQTTRINLVKPVTVILMYWTVNIADDGGMIFKTDVYDRDAAVLAGLNKPFSFRNAPILKDQTPR
ncbi:MAG: L,D-transpeptidase family protein [Deltaproteobacteria bacterium]|jgi:murein L,D-transpeptidase YcbB/YkuD|nr:L,D-transpeptidase family protein [Deltaproteobacteria bacterium]